MSNSQNLVEGVRSRFRVLLAVMAERVERLWAGAEARALGKGGFATIEPATRKLAAAELVQGDFAIGPQKLIKLLQLAGDNLQAVRKTAEDLGDWNHTIRPRQ